MLSMLGWLFAGPLVCYLLHATAPLVAVLRSQGRAPTPQPNGGLQDCAAVTLPVVSVLSTLGPLIFVLSAKDMIFGGPNQLGGTGTYSASIGIWLFAVGGLTQTIGFVLRLKEVGLLPRGAARVPPPALPVPAGAAAMAVPWLLATLFFLVELFASSDTNCSPIDLAALTLPPGLQASFLNEVGGSPNGRSLHLGPPHGDAPYTVFIGSGGMSSMDKVYGLLPDASGASATTSIIAEGLSHPNGVAARWEACSTDSDCGVGVSCDMANLFCQGATLYVAEWERVLQWPLADAMAALDGTGSKLAVGPANILVDGLPTSDGGHHACVTGLTTISPSNLLAVRLTQMEVYSVWPRREAVRAGGLAVQHLHSGRGRQRNRRPGKNERRLKPI